MFHRVNQRIAGCVNAKTADAAPNPLTLAPPLRYNGEGAGGRGRKRAWNSTLSDKPLQILRFGGRITESPLQGLIGISTFAVYLSSIAPVC